MQILDGKLENEGMGKNSVGGTELMAGRLASLDSPLFKEFQIIISRVEAPLDETKIRVLVLHDLPGDPASDHLKDGGWEKFHKLVFVTNWQMQAFINYYKIPWSRCIVLQNAIDPLEAPFDKPADKIKLIYHTTPHRGLDILVPVFEKLCEHHDDIELDVYSSFSLYGWGDRDKEFKHVIDACKKNPKINYFSTATNDEVREAVKKAHIFAYPSTWPETSCLSLMEAMSGLCVCVHSNYGALPETAAQWTHMYHYNEDIQEHAKIFYTVLTNAIEDIRSDRVEILHRLQTQKSYADIFYCWKNRALQWTALLEMLKDQVKDRKIVMPSQMFSYSTGG